jgi:hypothetical protein
LRIIFSSCAKNVVQLSFFSLTLIILNEILMQESIKLNSFVLFSLSLTPSCLHLISQQMMMFFSSDVDSTVQA